MPNFFAQRRQELTRKSGRFVSQHKIAVALGMTPSFVGLWERGLAAPQLKLVPALARVYGVSEERIERAIVELNRNLREAGKGELVGAK